jgi:hypothetical protein
MSWIVAIAGLVTAIILPFVVALLQQDRWTANTKRLIAIIITVLVGIATAIIAGIPTPETIVIYVLGIIGAMNMAYALFKAIGITSSWLDALTAAFAKKEN